MEELTTSSISLDYASMQLFEEEQFYFPLNSQRDARAFVKALALKGYGLKDLCAEIGEPEQNITSWRKGLGRSGIGKSIMERINRPYQEMLKCECSSVDHSEWLAAEVPKYVLAEKPLPRQLSVIKSESQVPCRSGAEPKVAKSVDNDQTEQKISKSNGEKVDLTSIDDESTVISEPGIGTKDRAHLFEMQMADSRKAHKEDSPGRKLLEIDVGESDENVVSMKDRVHMFEHQSPTKKSGDEALGDRSSPSKTVVTTQGSTKERMQMFEQHSPSSSRKLDKEELTPMVAEKNIKEATAGVSAKDRAQIFEQSSLANNHKSNNGSNGKDQQIVTEVTDTNEANTKNKVQIFEQLNAKKSATPSPRESPEKEIKLTEDNASVKSSTTEPATVVAENNTQQTNEKVTEKTDAANHADDDLDADVSLFVQGIIGGAVRAVEHEHKTTENEKVTADDTATSDDKKQEEVLVSCEVKEIPQLESCPSVGNNVSNCEATDHAHEPIAASLEPEIKVAVVEAEEHVGPLESPISRDSSTEEFESGRKKSEEHLGPETSEDEIVQDGDGLKRYKKKKRKSVTWALPEEAVAAMAEAKKADESAAKARGIPSPEGNAPIANISELDTDVDLMTDGDCGSFIVIPASTEVDVDTLVESKPDGARDADDEEFFDSVTTETPLSPLAKADDNAEDTEDVAEVCVSESYDSDQDDARVLGTSAGDDETVQHAMSEHPHDGPGFVYVFAEMRPSSGNVATQLFKLGASRFPERRLAQGRHFNIYLQMVANVPVTRRLLALQHTKVKVESFAVQGHEGWYEGTTGDFVTRVSQAASKYST